MAVRCKFKLAETREAAGSEGKTLVFYPEYDKSIPEDQAFNRYTPNGEFRMYCNNPAVLAQMKLGQQYYFDMSEVPPAAEQKAA